MESKQEISFELPREAAEALKTLAATRKIRLSGEVREGHLVIDSLAFADKDFSTPQFVPVNAPFKVEEAAAV
jgi:hypothetical protein